jgi:hypothetical protein
VEKFIKEMATQTSKNLPATINNNLEVYAVTSNEKSLMYATRLLSIEKKMFMTWMLSNKETPTIKAVLP